MAYTLMGFMVSSGMTSALQVVVHASLSAGVSARPHVSRYAGGWACIFWPNSVNSVSTCLRDDLMASGVVMSMLSSGSSLNVARRKLQVLAHSEPFEPASGAD